MKTLVCFIPVLHKGYLDLLKKYPDDVYVLGPDIIADYTSLTRDLRIIPPSDILPALEAFGIAKKLHLLEKRNLAQFPAKEIVMPDEDVSKDLAAKYFKNSNVTYEKVFLRWDKQITTQESVVPPHRVISHSAFDREMMRNAFVQADKSGDWWRQIGSVVVKGETILISSFNKVFPSDFAHATFGDLRSNFDAGQNIDLVATIHSEARAIGYAARHGISLEGASIYVTTFPCPPCAKLLLEAGIAKVYYSKGYSLVNAEKDLTDGGVEIVLVKD